jgi:hypothetical protein
MRKILLISTGFIVSLSLFAQDDPSDKKKKIDLSGRSNDHLMLQIGYAGWNGRPDSINTKGFSRTLNAYFLFDFPFKTNPRFSVAVGAGVGSEHIFLNKTFIGIKDQTSTLNFIDQSDTTHFKKNKLATSWLEAPVELRYTSNPLRSGNSVKFALGVKVGTMIDAHTRYKDLQNKSDQTLNNYVLKESSKSFFNTNRIVLTGRAGYGYLTLFYTYQLGPLFKEGTAAEIKPYSIGITLSGL